MEIFAYHTVCILQTLAAISLRSPEYGTTIVTVVLEQSFFSLRHSVNFLLRHFGHLSHSCIETRRNSSQWPIFSDILTEMT